MLARFDEHVHAGGRQGECGRCPDTRRIAHRRVQKTAAIVRSRKLRIEIESPGLDAQPSAQESLLHEHLAERLKIVGIDIRIILRERRGARSVASVLGLELRVNRQARPARQRIHIERQFNAAVGAHRMGIGERGGA